MTDFSSPHTINTADHTCEILNKHAQNSKRATSLIQLCKNSGNRHNFVLDWMRMRLTVALSAKEKKQRLFAVYDFASYIVSRGVTDLRKIADPQKMVEDFLASQKKTLEIQPNYANHITVFCKFVFAGTTILPSKDSEAAQPALSVATIYAMPDCPFWFGGILSQSQAFILAAAIVRAFDNKAHLSKSSLREIPRSDFSALEEMNIIVRRVEHGVEYTNSFLDLVGREVCRQWAAERMADRSKELEATLPSIAKNESQRKLRSSLPSEP